MITIYHNNRCSKSRETLSLLQEHGQEATVINYLDTPPTVDELRALLQKLGISPEELVRKTEALYKEQFAGKTFSDDEWIALLAQHPVLIERPIVVNGNKAVLGRPPQKVLDIL